MGVQIGGDKSWKQVIKGDLVGTFTWVNDEPALIITPKLASIKGAYIIALSSAYKYTDLNYLVQQSAACAKHIGMDVSSRFVVRRISDLILDNLQDLCEMPPEQLVMPKEKGKVVGEMVMKVNGETKVEQEMFEDA